VCEAQIILQADKHYFTTHTEVVAVHNLKFDIIVDQRNITSVDCVKNIETYYGQLPVILDEILQSQTLATRPITHIHV